MNSVLFWSIVGGLIGGLVGGVRGFMKGGEGDGVVGATPPPHNTATSDGPKAVDRGLPMDPDEPRCMCGVNPEWWCMQGVNNDPSCPMRVDAGYDAMRWDDMNPDQPMGLDPNNPNDPANLHNPDSPFRL